MKNVMLEGVKQSIVFTVRRRVVRSMQLVGE